MAATIAAPRPTDWRARTAGVRARWSRLPIWAQAGLVLALLLLISGYIRTRFIGGQFWMDEALSVGIASHNLAAIPGVLRHDGSPPLFYVLLHGWMTLFGPGESATHAMSLLFALLTVPIGMWAGWSLFGRRAGYMTAVLFAFSAFLTQYSQETRMYALMGLLGLLGTAGFLHAFLYRRRGFLILFAVAQAAMLYTHAWGIFFGAGSVLALIPIWRASPDRRGLVRDALMAYLGVGILFAPWLPTFIYQAQHTAAPWDSSPRFGAPVQLSRDLLGGDRVSVALLIAAVIGFIALVRGERRPAAERPTPAARATRSPDVTALWALIALPVATLALAWFASQITPAWVSRYFAPTLGPIILLAAFGCSRAGVVGIVAIAASIVFLANPASFTPEFKSDVRDIGGEMTPLVHAGDLVIVTQPEQVPLTWYYLPPGLQYANTIGRVGDPRYMNWVDALRHVTDTNWSATAQSLVASLRPGQQVLFVRPLTEGAQSWQAPWTQIVRRRSAQWGSILSSDPSLKVVAVAPHNYRGACCVADSAVLYQKVS
jgi:mannosyltransferase